MTNIQFDRCRAATGQEGLCQGERVHKCISMRNVWINKLAVIENGWVSVNLASTELTMQGYWWSYDQTNSQHLVAAGERHGGPCTEWTSPTQSQGESCMRSLQRRFLSSKPNQGLYKREVARSYFFANHLIIFTASSRGLFLSSMKAHG